MELILDGMGSCHCTNINDCNIHGPKEIHKRRTTETIFSLFFQKSLPDPLMKSIELQTILLFLLKIFWNRLGHISLTTQNKLFGV